MSESMTDLERIDEAFPRDEITSLLTSLRASAELLALRRRRAIVEASTAGLSQRLIAERLGSSQTAIHRVLQRAGTASQDSTDEVASIREAVLRHVVGEIGRQDLIERLARATPGHGSPRAWEDGYVRGGQDEIRLAWNQRLIDDQLFEDIRARQAELRAG